MSNADAIPLFFLLLQEAELQDSTWGLAVWYRLVTGSLVNAHACHRAGLFPLLLSWLAAASRPPHDPSAPGHDRQSGPADGVGVGVTSADGAEDRAGGNDMTRDEEDEEVPPPHPRVQVLTRVVSPSM